MPRAHSCFAYVLALAFKIYLNEIMLLVKLVLSVRNVAFKFRYAQVLLLPQDWAACDSALIRIRCSGGEGHILKEDLLPL